MAKQSPTSLDGVASHRTRMIRDRAWMKRARRRYLRWAQAWLEADRERIYDLADRMKHIGLYAATSADSDIRCGILSTLAKINGHENYTLRNQWLLKTGWCAYWGYSGSRRRRGKAKSA